MVRQGFRALLTAFAWACCCAPQLAWTQEKIAERLTPAAAPAANVSTTLGAGAESSVVRRWMAKTKLSLSSAIKIAQDKIGAGHVVEAYFKVENARPQYDVEIVTLNDEHQEITIDAIDGKIIELGAPDPEQKSELDIEAAVAKLNVSIPNAIEIASKKLPQARPFDAYGELRGAVLVLTVEFLDGAEVRAVRIDPTTAAVFSVDRQ